MNNPNKQRFGTKSHDFCTLFAVYLLAHGGTFLILNAIFWDDWTIYNTDPTTILRIFSMEGSIYDWSGHLHVALLSVGPWIYRILTFFLMFFSGILLWKIIERNDWIVIEDRFTITLLFLVLPFNWARVALIDFPYVLCYFAFFLAWYCIGRNRVLALLLFLISFNTNSLLVFFALPMADWYFRDNRTFSIRTSVKWILSKSDFVIAPFAYWIIKNIYYKPYGYYAGYNEQFSVKHLISSPVYMARDFVYLDINVFLLICLFILSMLMIRKSRGGIPESNRKRLLITGCAALVCALFPYWILGLVPTFFEWNSRHQLLMPLGVALLLTWLFTRLTTNTHHFATAVLVSVSISISIQTYCELAFDWSKQQVLMSLFLQDNKIRDAGLVIFDDRTNNAQNRIYRFYEWNGLMKHALKDERHFGLNPDEVNAYTKGDYDQYFTYLYNANLHVRQPNQTAVIVRIEYTDRSASRIPTLALRSIQGKANYKILVNECDCNCLDKLGGIGDK